jgi:hypothetical protein
MRGLWKPRSLSSSRASLTAITNPEITTIVAGLSQATSAPCGRQIEGEEPCSSSSGVIYKLQDRREGYDPNQSAVALQVPMCSRPYHGRVILTPVHIEHTGRNGPETSSVGRQNLQGSQGR